VKERDRGEEGEEGGGGGGHLEAVIDSKSFATQRLQLVSNFRQLGQVVGVNSGHMQACLVDEGPVREKWEALISTLPKGVRNVSAVSDLGW